MENTKSGFERFNEWMRNSTTLRLVTIGILILLLLIPLNMIKKLIHEREYRKQEAMEEVSSKWGQHQLISGPVMSIPYYEYKEIMDQSNDQASYVKTKKYAHFLPEELNIEGELFPQELHRGIYDVIVYKTNIQINGFFKQPDLKALGISGNILWDEVTVSLGITDTRNVKDNIYMTWNEESITFQPGLETTDVIRTGISSRIPMQDSGDQEYSFSLELAFNGSSSLQFLPIGKDTRVHLSSAWNNPSFDGAFLPDERDNIDTGGFTADWHIIHLNRSFPQAFKSSNAIIQESAFGVNLLLPVDNYQKSIRSVKYGILIIVLTFMVFFLIQVRSKVRIHPFQYILVGLSLCVFYTLLIAISEHLNFDLAYLIGGMAIILLNLIYARSIFRNNRFSLIISLVMVVLYSFIYVIIQLQDFALLYGSIGLFLVLAALMYFTRNIDWYKSGNTSNEG